MISVLEALERIRTLDVKLPVESCPVEKSRDRVLAETVEVREDLPRFDQSAMDGYAVRAGDLEGASESTPVRLRCEQKMAAGQSQKISIDPGEAARIFTGAPVPDGANAVVIQENVHRDNHSVTFYSPTTVGANIRRKGEEVQQGSRLMNEEEVINTGSLGLLLSQGYQEIQTYRSPDVAVVATGDELVDPSNTPSTGQKRDTNTPLIKDIINPYTDSITIERLGDQRKHLKTRLGELLRDRDVVVVSGGVSVGDRDYVRPVLDELGVDEIFWKVNQKPGKPLYLGQTGDSLVLGLPGNPVSATVSFYVYGIPLIRKIMGYPTRMLELSCGRTRIKSNRHHPKNRTEFVRARTRKTPEGYRSNILQPQGSHMLTGLARANSLVVLPEKIKTVTPDEHLLCYFLPDTPGIRRET